MELLTPGTGLILWQLIVFVGLFLLLSKLAWKPIISSLKEREQSIHDALSTAEKARQEMAQLQSENEKLLKEARETRDKIVNEAKDQAKAEANKIMQETTAAINQQKMAAIIDVKNQVGNLVIEVSEKVLRRELANKADQESYISKLSEEIKLN